MITLPSLEIIKQCQKSNPWTFGNNVLYRLCSENPKHIKDDIIIAKVWLIGRSYAAAIERGRSNALENNVSSEEFQTVLVVDAFKNSDIDSRLGVLAKRPLSYETAPLALEAHNMIMLRIHTITGLEKRSLCSKYLHFHLPGHFFLYDSRATQAIGKYVSRIPPEFKPRTENGKFDNVYSNFFYKALVLRENIYQEYGILMTPRQIDNLLLLDE